MYRVIDVLFATPTRGGTVRIRGLPVKAHVCRLFFVRDKKLTRTCLGDGGRESGARLCAGAVRSAGGVVIHTPAGVLRNRPTPASVTLVIVSLNSTTRGSETAKHKARLNRRCASLFSSAPAFCFVSLRHFYLTFSPPSLRMDARVHDDRQYFTCLNDKNIVIEGGSSGGRVFLVDFGGVQGAITDKPSSTVIGTYG